MKTRQWLGMDLARRTGLRPNTISDVLLGRTVRPTTLKLIAQAFDADPEGTALAVGSTAAKGGAETMIHDDARFGDLYLIWRRAPESSRDRIWRCAHREDQKRHVAKGDVAEGDA